MRIIILDEIVQSKYTAKYLQEMKRWRVDITDAIADARNLIQQKLDERTVLLVEPFSYPIIGFNPNSAKPNFIREIRGVIPVGIVSDFDETYLEYINLFAGRDFKFYLKKPSVVQYLITKVESLFECTPKNVSFGPTDSLFQ